MLSVFTLKNRDKWDDIVRSFREYDAYWLSGYAKGFSLHGDGEPLLFYYENGDTRGINVVMKRDVSEDERFKGRIPKGQYYDLSTPYGYGGWLIEGDDKASLFDEYGYFLNSQGVISEFVRFHPVLCNHADCQEFYELVQLGEVVHMDLTSPDIIWGNITSKNRNVIRKAEKNGVTIHTGQSPELYEQFRSIYNGTMDKDHADEYYYFGREYYDSLLNDLHDNARIFYAEKDGMIIAASIILNAGCRLNYHLSGSIREYNSFAPSNLLLYKAALWGCENGYKTLYLGGGVGSAEDSLLKFKKAFYRGDLKRYYIGKRVFDQGRYDELVALRGFPEGSFFPRYRSL